MSSKFVELSGNGYPAFVDPSRVEVVGVNAEGQTVITMANGAFILSPGSPAEVVAKLQGKPLSGVLNNVAAPPAESEAVQLLERVMRWYDLPYSQCESFFKLHADIAALLAKLKGGA